MCCYINLMIILTLYVPLIYSQADIISLSTLPYWCGKELTLKCNLSSSCCNVLTRSWRKGGTEIISNGAEITTSGKYSETVVDAENYFTLTINDLEDDDFGKGFICLYGGFTSAEVKLNEEDLLCTPCAICILVCLACTVGGMVGVYLLECLNLACNSSFVKSPCHECCSVSSDEGNYLFIFCGKDYSISKEKKALRLAVLVSAGGLFLYGLIPGFLFGWFCYHCYIGLEPVLLLFGLGALLFIVIFYWSLEFLSYETFSTLRYVVYVGLTFLILPLIVLVPYECCCKGGNNRSTESGSSCWPPCRVGQDPITPDPENARSLLKKKRADKITEEKPVAVVRSQPPKARHVKTDNTESTKYSAENEKFSAGLDKGRTPRPLPSIGQPIDSPRPLPQMPPSTQQQKGGIQLQPLGDSTSEKKKKKRRKKKEIKNSDEED